MPDRYSEEWIDEDDYPSDRDMEEFGYSAPPDYDPLTVGYVRGTRVRFWTRGRLVMAGIAFLLLFSLVIAEIITLLHH